jgi:uncharacterized OB-fold protein
MPILEHITHLGEARAWVSDIPFESLYTAGVAGQRWLSALRDEGKLYATRCPKCERVYVPARLFCERCFAHLENDTWQVAGPEGTIESFTILHLAPDGSAGAPQFIALVRLDGADTLFPHRLGDLGARKPRIGMRVKAVFKPKSEREGSINDIRHFAPA